MGFIRHNFLGGAENDAADAQIRRADEAIDVQTATGETATARLDPFATVGTDAIAGTGGETEGSVLDLIRNNDNLAFERSEGFEAINKSAAAGGKGLLSGERGRDLVEFNRGLETRNDNTRINQLLTLIQGGQGAAGGQANIDVRIGENISGLRVGQGDSRAAGIIGGKNAVGSTINTLAKVGAGIASGGLSGFLDAFKAKAEDE